MSEVVELFANTMPSTWPAVDSSGPPELPCSTSAATVASDLTLVPLPSTSGTRVSPTCSTFAPPEVNGPPNGNPSMTPVVPIAGVGSIGSAGLPRPGTATTARSEVGSK